MASGHRNNWQQKSNSGELEEKKHTNNTSWGWGGEHARGAGRGTERENWQTDGWTLGWRPSRETSGRSGQRGARAGRIRPRGVAERWHQALNSRVHALSLRAALEQVQAPLACGLEPAWDPEVAVASGLSPDSYPLGFQEGCPLRTCSPASLSLAGGSGPTSSNQSREFSSRPSLPAWESHWVSRLSGGPGVEGAQTCSAVVPARQRVT